MVDLKRVLSRTLEELELSERTGGVLAANCAMTVGDIVKLSEGDLLRLPNFGRKSLNEIKEVLASMGLRLGMQFAPDCTLEQAAKELADASREWDRLTVEIATVEKARARLQSAKDCMKFMLSR